MTAPDTDTLAGLLAECTPGPWEWAAIYQNDVHNLVHWVSGETFPSGDPRYIQVHSDGSAGGEYGPDIDVAGADARLIALAPELAAEVIALRAQAAKDRARIERLRAALRPFSIMAGEMFARNWNKDGVAISFVGKDGPIRLTFTDFLAARAALEDGE